MADVVFQTKSYFSYWLDAVDEHSLHSPFFFDFYTQVVKDTGDRSSFLPIERLRRQLLSNTRSLEIKDLGTGGYTHRRINKIARTSLTLPRYARLLSRLVNYMKAETVVELGTSLGITTLYLALPAKARVTTFEGCPQIAAMASLTFEFARAKNIRLLEGDIATTLPAWLQRVRRLDFVYIDANHRYDATMKYAHLLFPCVHEKSVIVIDDIHHSAGMERAWNELRQHDLVHASADLFRCGLLFFDPSLNKQHVILQV